jgi:hypothetical protein
MADFLRAMAVAVSLCTPAVVAPAAALAGEADVVGVVVRHDGEGRYSFDVTVRHADAGWDHYANAWQVVSADGKTVYGTRTLLHPHEDEQPFTRSLSGVAIPDGVDAVVVRARDSVHGFGGREMTVKIER